MIKAHPINVKQMKFIYERFGVIRYDFDAFLDLERYELLDFVYEKSPIMINHLLKDKIESIYEQVLKWVLHTGIKYGVQLSPDKRIRCPKILNSGSYRLIKLWHKLGVPWVEVEDFMTGLLLADWPNLLTFTKQDYELEAYKIFVYADKNGCKWDPQTILKIADRDNRWRIVKYILSKYDI